MWFLPAIRLTLIGAVCTISRGFESLDIASL
jgi:hypothetical protein